MSPVKFIGRTTWFQSKRLFDILCRLKNFGVGRIVYRNTFFERYPEPSYYVITRVDPDMSDPTQAGIDFKVKSLAYGMKVFRGEPLGENPITKAYKHDWRMVPRDQEKVFLSYKAPERPVSVVPDSARFPPLLELLIIQEQRRSGKFAGDVPMLPLRISTSANSRAMYESELNKLKTEQIDQKVNLIN